MERCNKNKTLKGDKLFKNLIGHDTISQLDALSDYLQTLRPKVHRKQSL